MIRIESWFLNKNFTSNERIVIESSNDQIIERETEKASLIRFESDYGTLKTWVPKSLYTTEEVKEISEEAKKQVKNFVNKIIEQENAKYDYYNRVLNFAKENKIKGVRKYMKLSNIIAKIKENGLEVPAR